MGWLIFFAVFYLLLFPDFVPLPDYAGFMTARNPALMVLVVLFFAVTCAATIVIAFNKNISFKRIFLPASLLFIAMLFNLMLYIENKTTPFVQYLFFPAACLIIFKWTGFCAKCGRTTNILFMPTKGQPILWT